MTRASRSVISGLLAIGMAVASASAAAAAAQTIASRKAGDLTAPTFPAGTTLASAISWTESQLGARATELATLTAGVGASTTLTASDRSALTSLLATDSVAIDALKPVVSAESTIAGVEHDASLMVLDYHVYAFVAPVVQTVISADASLAASARLSAQLPALQAAVTAAHLPRRDGVQATLRALARLLGRVNSGVGTTSATLIGLSASSVPGSLPTIAAAIAAAAHAASAVRLAQSDLAEIASDLAHAGVVGAQRA